MNTPTTNYIEIDGEGKWIEDTDAREMATQNAADIKTIQNNLGIISASEPSQTQQTVAGNYKTLCSINLQKGKYIVTAQAYALITFTGRFILTLPKSPNEYDDNCILGISNGDAYCGVNLTKIVNVTENSATFNLRVFTDSVVTVSGITINAIKLV